MAANKISQSEFSIMQVLWSQNQATSQEVINLLSESSDLQSHTIQGMLSRMVRKGIVGVRKHGRYNIYFPTITEEDRLRAAPIDPTNHICSRKIGKRIVEMIENNSLSFTDLAAIQNALTAKQPFAVEEVMCNCPPGTCTCKNCNCKREKRQFTQTPSNIYTD